MRPGPVLFINPNSSEEVTEGIRAAVMPYAQTAGPAFECLTTRGGPPTLMTDEDGVNAARRIAAIAEDRTDASALVICCFSDPGLELARSKVSIPVIGCQEASVLTAMMIAQRFGIIALSPASIPRHTRKLAQMGVLERLAGESALPSVSAADAGTSDEVFEQTIEIGRELRARGAGAIVPGCAGFAPRRRELERILGVSVVDPVQAAAAVAMGAVWG